MKKMVIVLFTLSICLASGNIKKQMDDLMRSLQDKYHISGPEDLYKLKTQQTPQHGRTASRDMEDLVGDWMIEEEKMELFVTVGSDQSIPDIMTLMAMVEADGSITATASDYVAELKYLFDPSIMEGDDGGGDCDISCEGEYDDYMNTGIDVSDEYCECCHEDYAIDEICEDDGGGGGVEFEYESVADLYANYGSILETVGTGCDGCPGNLEEMDAVTSFDIAVQSEFENWANNYEFGEYYFQFIDENENDTYDGGEIYAVSCEADESYMTVAYDGSVYALQFENFWMEAYDFDWESDDDDGEEPPTPEDFLDWFDANDDGVLTLDEIIDGINATNDESNEPPLSSEDEEYIEYAYNDSDENGDGVLDLDELENFIYMLENDEDDDDGPGLMIMNMNFMEFFMVNIGMAFGMDLDSLNIDNPTVLAFGSTNDDDNIDLVQGMLFGETGVIELMADPEEAVAATSIDDTSITFTNLSLYDSTGTAVLTVTGTIGPGLIDFIAGVEQAYPFLEGMEDMFGDGEDDYEAYMLFYEDSTGMEIEVEYYDDEYYYDYPEIHIDTSYFSWSATSDSLFLYEESEYYYDELDTTELAYFISSTDTLNMGASFDPCEDEDSFEECLEFASEEIAGLDELEDIQSLRISMGRVLTPGSFMAVDAGNGSLPQEFNLYANYPNPFNPVTTIRFDVGQNSGDNTLLRIYDITGRSVATLINGQLQIGTYEIQWDARGFASGIYFSELISGTKRHTQKMVLLK